MRKSMLALLVCLLILPGCRRGEDMPPAPESGFASDSQPEIIAVSEQDVPESEWSQPEASLLPPPSAKESGEPSAQVLPDERGSSAAQVPPDERGNSAAAREPQSASQPASSSSKGEPDTAKIERELLRLINREREAVGAEALGVQEDMRFAARIRSPEVLTSLSHTRPDGTAYYTAFDEAGFVYAGHVHGENIATLHFSPGLFDAASAAAEMFKSLKNSPGHYKNMTNADYLHAGVGCYANFDGELWHIGSVQLFASR